MSTASEADGIDSKETSAKFHRYFNTETSSFQIRIDQLGNTSLAGGERVDAIDHCLAGIARLSNEVKDASAYLPPYDQRQYSESLKALTARLESSRAAFAPKPKFAFKSTMKRPSAMSLSDADVLPSRSNYDSSGTPSASQSYAATPARQPSPLPSMASNGRQEQDAGEKEPVITATAISHLKNTSKIISADLFSSSSGSEGSNSSTTLTLSHLYRTFLNLPSSPHTFTSLTLHDIDSSVIDCGTIDGPIHITKVTNSVLYIPRARQFRMHKSRDVRVFLRVGSRPVIEDCEGISFAPARNGARVDGEAKEVNMWDQVDDFNWLRKEKNPHWKVMYSDVDSSTLGFIETPKSDDINEILESMGIKRIQSKPSS